MESRNCIGRLIGRNYFPKGHRNFNGKTPLFVASQNGHVDVVKELLADGRVDVNKVRPVQKDTPLMIAQNGKLETVKVLLRCPKTDITIQDRSGYTALKWAKQNGYTVLVLRMAHRKWIETEQQPGTAEPGNMLGCCLNSFHFLWAILITSTVHN